MATSGSVGGRSRGSGRTTTARSASTPTFTGSPVAGSAVANTSIFAQEEDVNLEEQILSTEECKKRYEACMGDFCQDPSNKYNPGTCLCHPSISKFRPREEGLFQKLKRIQIMNSQKEALKLGTTYKAYNDDVAEQMGFNEEDENSDDPWADSVDFGIGNLMDGGDAKRKEGDALKEEAMDACAQYLKLCPSGKKYILKAFDAKMNRDCIGYNNSLREAEQKAEMVMQKLYNDQQAIQQKMNNKYTAGECAQELKGCMQETAECGEDFAFCKTQKLLEEKKIFCENILDQCADVKDTIWTKFIEYVTGANPEKKVSVEIQYRQERMKELEDCVRPYCDSSMTVCNISQTARQACISSLDQRMPRTASPNAPTLMDIFIRGHK
ncbi:MAG: hypothetical protein JXR30_03825 [Alphaproteobacteria bacterium]|nr:hypothetical protein [Alphaproteobacteria bacterium]